MVLPSGVCKYLDEETNLCRIYSARPIFCNADAFYDKYLSDKLTRQEFYRQNKKACRRFQGLETSSEKFELEEWVLPAIQNLNAGQGLESLSAEDRAILEKAGMLDSAETSPAGAKPPGVPDELSLESMSEEERKIYEENNIKPFERNIRPANAVPLNCLMELCLNVYGRSTQKKICISLPTLARITGAPRIEETRRRVPR